MIGGFWLRAEEKDMVAYGNTRGVVRDSKETEIEVEFPGGRKVWVPRRYAFKIIPCKASEWEPGQVPEAMEFDENSPKYLASDRIIF